MKRFALTVLAAGLILIFAAGCGREEGDGSAAAGAHAGRDAADESIAGLRMDRRSASLLGDWLGGTYHLGRAGVNKASVDYHVVWTQNHFREPIERRGHFVYDEGGALPEWDPAVPEALLTRWIDAASFRKDYASAVFTADEQADGRVRVSVAGSPATNVRAFLFAADGTLEKMEVLVWTKRLPRATAVLEMTFETRVGRRLLTRQAGACDLPEAGPGQDELTLTYAEHGAHIVPIEYHVKISSGKYYWSWKMKLANWKVNEEVTD